MVYVSSTSLLSQGPQLPVPECVQPWWHLPSDAALQQLLEQRGMKRGVTTRSGSSVSPQIVFSLG